MRSPRRAWPIVGALCLAYVVACATTSGGTDDDDDTPGDIDAHVGGTPDAPFFPTPDAPVGGPPDASVPIPDAKPPMPDAYVPPPPPDASTYPFCTTSPQCMPDECCFKFPPGAATGLCTLGEEVPIFGCIPADQPDAGP
jgi:hypothetical protein